MGEGMGAAVHARHAHQFANPHQLIDEFARAA
jgi:hypothetical protein